MNRLAVHQEKPRGVIAYLKDGAAYRLDLATGVEKQVPGSAGAVAVHITPAGRAITFAVPAGSAGPDGATRCQEYLYLSSGKPPFKIGPDNRPVRDFTHKDDTSRVASPQGYDAGLNLVVYGKTDRIQLTEDYAPFRRPAKHRALFTPTQPKRLLAAVRQGGRAGLPLLPADESWRDPKNWRFGGVELTRDGKTAYFAANGGTGDDVFGYFAVEIATGSTRFLSRAGVFAGKIPHFVTLSRWDQRLFFLYDGVGATAARSGAVTVDRKRERATGLFDPSAGETPGAAYGRATWGCWSPDESFVAVACRVEDTRNVYLFRAETGRTSGTIAGASMPSWGG